MVDRIRNDDPKFGDEYDRQRARAEVIRPIVEARKARGWSQRELAAEAGIQQPVLARLENGDTDPKLSTVTKVCTALGLRMAYVNDGERRAG